MMHALALALGAGGRVPGLPLPAGFTFPAAYTPVIRPDGSGGYTASIDARGFVDPAVWTGPLYYVATTGNDSNAGLSEAQAVRSVSKALQLGNATNAPYRVSIGAGEYSITNGLHTSSSNVFPTQDCALIGVGTVKIGSWTSSLTWPGSTDATYTNTYKVVRNNVMRVFDIVGTDSFGNYLELAKVADAATCNSTPGSWFMDGTNLYVRRADGAAVTNANTKVFLGAESCRLPNAFSIYLENIEFQGGQNGTLNANFAVTRNIAAVDCAFKYAGATAAPMSTCRMVDMTGLALFVRCVGEAATRDAFTGTWTLGGTVGLYGVTIDCRGRDNGRAGATSNNGLTAHNGIKWIDVNGNYPSNYGANVAIVDDCQMWCVGTDADDSLGDVVFGGSFEPNSYSAGNTAQLWLEGCTGSGSTYALQAYNTATIRKRNCTISGIEQAAPTATITTF